MRVVHTGRRKTITHRRHFPARLAGTVVIVLALVACGKGNTNPVVSRPRPTPLPTATPLPPLPTAPPPGSTDNPLGFIFVNPSGVPNVSLTEALAKKLSDETKLIVQVRATQNYAEARKALCTGSAVVISANAFAYLSAVAQSCGEGLYTADVKGAASSQGQMVAGLGRDVYDIKHFAGYRFCRPGALSVNGWFVPTLALKANGVNPLGDLDSVIDSGSDEGVIRDIIALKCDVGAARLGAEANVPGSKAVLVIEKLPPVPNDTVMISLQLDARLRGLLGDTLRNHLADIAQIIQADSLVPTDDKNFDALRNLFKSADVDPAAMGD